jgi:shikimate kinase
VSVVVLTGPPGAGKSEVGALLAAELGVPFADTDDLVAAAAGKPVGDIFVDDGEPVFRELERAAVARGLEPAGAAGAFGPDGGVLALGSGAVLDPDVRRMIAGRPVVYLEAGFSTIAKRTGMDRPRVVIPGNPRGMLRAMLEERRPVYAELATITVPTDDMAPEEVAADLAKRLRA